MSHEPLEDLTVGQDLILKGKPGMSISMCGVSWVSILWVHKHFDRMLNMFKLAVTAVAMQTQDLYMTYNPFHIQETNKQAFKMPTELMTKTNIKPYLCHSTSSQGVQENAFPSYLDTF